MSFRQFIISKSFFKQLGIILGLSLVLLFIVISGLKSYTDHGEYILVPHLHGLNGDSLVENSDPYFLQYILIDSLYDANEKPGGVFKQSPLAGAKVKKGRKVYVTIVAKGQEFVAMPNLVDLSIRSAIDLIIQSRLNVNQLIFIDNFARNAVLAQLIRQDTIAPDTLVHVGTPINLIIGNGYNPAGVYVPFLIGKMAEDARELILKSGLNFGGADTLGRSRDDLRVYQQYPYSNQKESLFLGDAVRIVLRSGVNFKFDSLVSRLRSDTSRLNVQSIDSALLNLEYNDF